MVAPSVTIQMPPNVVLGQDFEFSVTFHPGDMAGIMVVGKSNVTEVKGTVWYYEPNGANAGQWVELKGDKFGPSTGFPLMEATSKFKANLTEVPAEPFIVYMETVPAEGEEAKVIAEAASKPVYIEASDTITYPDGGAVGGGCLGFKRLVLASPALDYPAGGIAIDPRVLAPRYVLGVSAKGGATAWLDTQNRVLHLYDASGAEFSGVITDLKIILLGY